MKTTVTNNHFVLEQTICHKATTTIKHTSPVGAQILLIMVNNSFLATISYNSAKSATIQPYHEKKALWTLSNQSFNVHA